MRAGLVIQDAPPRDGQDWESQCARCGSSTFCVVCEACGGDGRTEYGELYEQDPLFYSPSDTATCDACGGDGSWEVCLSDKEWCQANPLEGREVIERGQIEWFTVNRPEGVA